MTKERRKSLEQLPDVLTPSDLLSVLPIGRNRLYSALKAKELPSRRLGQKILITKQSLMSYLGLAQVSMAGDVANEGV